MARKSKRKKRSRKPRKQSGQSANLPAQTKSPQPPVTPLQSMGDLKDWMERSPAAKALADRQRFEQETARQLQEAGEDPGELNEPGAMDRYFANMTSEQREDAIQQSMAEFGESREAATRSTDLAIKGAKERVKLLEPIEDIHKRRMDIMRGHVPKHIPDSELKPAIDRMVRTAQELNSRGIDVDPATLAATTGVPVEKAREALGHPMTIPQAREALDIPPLPEPDADGMLTFTPDQLKDQGLNVEVQNPDGTTTPLADAPDTPGDKLLKVTADKTRRFKRGESIPLNQDPAHIEMAEALNKVTGEQVIKDGKPIPGALDKITEAIEREEQQLNRLKVARDAYQGAAKGANDPAGNYLAACEIMRRTAQESKAPQHSRLYWSKLQEARIIEVPSQLLAAWTSVMQRQLASLTTAELTRKLHAQRLPEQLPFKSTYLAFNPVHPIDHREVPMAKADAIPGFHRLFSHLTGFLVTQDLVVCFTSSLFKSNDPSDPIPQGVTNFDWAYRASEGWRQDAAFSAWWVPWTMEWINSHQTLIEEGTRRFSYRRAYQKAAKKARLRPLPRPYYTVTMHDRTVDEAELWMRRKATARSKPGHRFDQRGNWNLRLVRGPLPISDKDRKRLTKRKYVILETERPPPEVQEQMAARKHEPKRRDEWLAYLRYWQRECIKGDESLPYIPSVRKSARAKKVKS